MEWNRFQAIPKVSVNALNYLSLISLYLGNLGCEEMDYKGVIYKTSAYTCTEFSAF
jgi:hypothetical protein